MNRDYFASAVFAEKFNSYFGEKAVGYNRPKTLTDVALQESVLAHWSIENKYSEQIQKAVDEFRAAQTLDHKINAYYNKLHAAVLTYKVYIANLETHDYNFSKVTWWPYAGAQKILDQYNV